MNASLHTSLVGMNAQFDSQPVGRIVAVWVDALGVLQLGIRSSAGLSQVYPFTSVVVLLP